MTMQNNYPEDESPEGVNTATEEEDEDDEIFGVDDSDILGAESGEDIDAELLDVSDDDVMYGVGKGPPKKKKAKKAKPAPRLYPQPPTTMGGLQC